MQRWWVFAIILLVTPPAIAGLDFYLESITPPPKVTGVVLHEGTPIADAVVRVDRPFLKFETRTNAAGRFEFTDIPDDLFVLRATHAEGNGTIVVEVDAEGRAHDLKLETRGGY